MEIGRGKTIVIALLYTLFLADCINPNENTEKRLEIKRYLPENPRNGSSSLLYSIQEIGDSLGLKKLYDGADFLEIRIWFGYAFTNKQKLLVLRLQRTSQCEAFLYKFEPIYYDSTSGKNYKLIVQVDTLLSNSMTCELILNAINKFEIIDLKGAEEINNYPHPTDPDNIAFEISTKNEYKLVSYPSPSLALNIKEANNVLQIVKYFENIFKVNLSSS